LEWLHGNDVSALPMPAARHADWLWLSHAAACRPERGKSSPRWVHELDQPAAMIDHGGNVLKTAGAR
jgi:hypothetical protein